MNSRYLPRSLLIVGTAVVVAAGCLGDNYPLELMPPTGPLTTATATIEDKLPVDGCSYVVVVDGVRYAPDAYSRAAIIAHHLPSTATVVIRYRLTGNIGQVVCELAKVDLAEIAFVFVD